MKIFFVAIAFLIIIGVFAQANYWQQRVNYKITVSSNDKNNSLKGWEELEHTNNSPDPLSFIWFPFGEEAGTTPRPYFDLLQKKGSL